MSERRPRWKMEWEQLSPGAQRARVRKLIDDGMSIEEVSCLFNINMRVLREMLSKGI